MNSKPQGVTVLPSWAIGWWCRMPDSKPILTCEEIDQIYATSRRSSTWAGI